ncbi:putative proteinconserved [Aphelenchoides avenae]|nr:putative proteinconserved [Aphelenchus avenae]
MDLIDANLAKTLECPVCLDVFDEPKLLSCGHTVCQKCVNMVVAKRQTDVNADMDCMKCPECGEETMIPPGGPKTNYRLVDLVYRAQKQLVDVHACNDCGKQAPVADMFTCETCQESVNIKPLWICAVCAMKKHRGHTMPECNKATRQQIQDACQGVSSSGSLADMYIGLTMSHLNGALEKTELVSQLLNKRRREFTIIEKRVRCADDKLTQEDLAASLEAATDLKQKFEKASTTDNQVGKDLESVLQSFHNELEELLPTETVDESETNEDSNSDPQESLIESDEQKCSVPTVDNSTATGFVPMSISSIVAPQLESRRSEIPPPPEGSVNGIASKTPQLANAAQSNNAWLMAPYTGYGTQQVSNF